MNTDQVITNETVEIDDVNISYFDNHKKPKKKHQTIVLLHGIPTSSYLFRKVAPLLDSYRLIIPDFPGFGNSDKPEYINYSLPVISKYIEKFILEVVGPNERVHLVGHDIGGPVGLFFLSRNLKRAKSLMLINTTLFLEHFRPPIAAVTGLIPFAGQFITELITNEFVIESSMRLLLKARISNKEILTYAKPYSDERARKALAQIFSSYQDSIPMISALRSFLEEVHIPTTILFGRDDPFCLPVNAELFAERIGQSKLVFSQHSGHFLPDDDPECLASEIRKLISRH